ncbi:MAG TPA: hypothetical protein VFN26_03870 [Candidatus Acidoferrum sp.]|nr:hypothetical protein [Candidatus Acidoferrum sp.]
MNKLPVLALLLSSLFSELCFPASAHSQEKNYVDLFIGATYGKMALGSETALFAPRSRNFYGLEFSAKLNLHKNVGIILLDAGILYGRTKIPSPLGSQFDANTSLQSYQFLFGPEVAYRNRKVQIFGHGLFGANHTAVIWNFGNNNPTLIGRTHFALGAGGGLDVNFKEHLAYRVFQVDYIPTLVNGRWEKNYRVSTGIVVHF